jgi:PAS domain S-box-containing protein
MTTPGDEDVAALKQRVADLERTLEERRRVERQVTEAGQRFHRLLDLTGEMVAVSISGRIMEVNDSFVAAFGYERRELVGMRIIELVAPESLEMTMHHVSSGSSESYDGVCLKKDGTRFVLEVCGRPIVYHGLAGRVTVMRDITERRRAEEAARAALVEQETLRAQQAVLAELSTPILPITEDVLVLPLIGAINPERAAEVQRALVEGVSRHRARAAILDVTGVPAVDASIAAALIAAARAARLLGAEVILTGIGPAVAQRLVDLGVDLGGVITGGTLQQGVSHALARR